MTRSKQYAMRSGWFRRVEWVIGPPGDTKIMLRIPVEHPWKQIAVAAVRHEVAHNTLNDHLAGCGLGYPALMELRISDTILTDAIGQARFIVTMHAAMKLSHRDLALLADECARAADVLMGDEEG